LGVLFFVLGLAGIAAFSTTCHAMPCHAMPSAGKPSAVKNEEAVGL
jgi:hypothetical protein